jgi:hypothetical protein
VVVMIMFAVSADSSGIRDVLASHPSGRYRRRAIASMY